MESRTAFGREDSVADARRFQKVAILGAGALGLYYGGRLAQAGCEVHFIVRSDYARLQESGLVLREGDDVTRIFPVHAHTTPEGAGTVDLVLITLKTVSNGELARLLPPLLSERTIVVTLQNGLGNEDHLARMIPPDAVYGGLCFIASMRTAPGEVTCLHRGTITFGAYCRPADAKARMIGELFQRAGIPNRVVDRLDEARWRKLVWNIPFNGLGIAAGGVSTDIICANARLSAEVRALMDEVRSAAAALGFSIPEEFAREQYDVTPAMGAYFPSSVVDFLEKKPVEVESIWGEPLRQALAAGAAVPRMTMLHALIVQLAAQRQSQADSAVFRISPRTGSSIDSS